MKKTLSLLIALFFCFGALAEMPDIEDEMREHIVIRACGDLMMHQGQLEKAHAEDDVYDFHPAYQFVVPSLSNADYTIANLETTVGLYGKEYYSGFPRFNAPESLLETIKDSGVDFLTLANNHMLDRYFDGMKQTVDNVESFGFDFSGAYRTPEENAAPKIVDVNGFKLGFLCYTEHTNGMEAHCSSGATQYGIKYIRNTDFSEDVNVLREAGAEFIIALPHWGTEYQRHPDSYVRAWAQKMADAGIDAILGSHPHMVQPIEWLETNVDGIDKKVLVAWSMGNFISNMKIQYSDSGMIVQFTLVRTENGIQITDVGYVPIYCWKSSDNICALNSKAYLSERPEGMDDNTYSRLKTSYNELEELIGDGFKILTE